ncbi:hypothetical protein AAD018_003185 [Aestuariibius insulae]|uniref:hypothetical protein n=1 Tax=Aestuariibius insulae TaxID=2058287 RepID=UPI00345E82BE
MTPDLFMCIGVLAILASIPAIFGSIKDGEAPRLAALVLLFGAATVYYAISQRPGGYTLEEIPQAFVNVIGQFL